MLATKVKLFAVLLFCGRGGGGIEWKRVPHQKAAGISMGGAAHQQMREGGRGFWFWVLDLAWCMSREEQIGL